MTAVAFDDPDDRPPPLDDAEAEALASNGPSDAAHRTLALAGLDHHQADDEADAGPPAVTSVGRLPERFWTASPALEVIRRAAWARLVSPEAVLCAVLARVAACTSHTVELPPTVGRWAGLTYWTVLAGPPGAAKSSAAGIAAELVPAPAGLDLVDGAPPGSGEGLVELLYGMVTEPDPDTGKPTKVRRLCRHNVLVVIDEGAMLADLANRKGSTLAGNLRSAWSHQTVGSANASAERDRKAPGTAYVYGIVAGIQPDHAGPLVIPDGTGTCDRIVWASAWSPPPPDGIDWPGPINWRPPSPNELHATAATRDRLRRSAITVAPAVVAEIRAAHIAAQAGTDDRPPHWRLRRLKTAALLASLDGHALELTEHDWALAGLVMDASDAVADHLAEHLAGLDALRAEQADRRQARRAVIVAATSEADAEARALASAARSAARAVHKHHADGTCQGCTRRCITLAVASKHRQLVSVDTVADAALDAGWITEAEGRYCPAESRPA